MPHVVPQLRTITLGGAVTGLGIESTSFRSRLPHESVLEMDVFTGSGGVVTCRPGPDGEHADLFDAFPNSYGSLGYATRLRIRLEPVPGYVALRHVRFDDLGLLAKSIAEIAETASYDGERVDAVDGVAFEPGSFTSRSRGGPTSRRRPATTPASRSSTARSSSARPTCSRPTTTCGAGTPTGSGARARSASEPTVRRLWPRRWRARTSTTS